MSFLKTSTLSFGIVFAAISLNAQNVTMTTGGQSKTYSHKKAEPVGFTVGGDNYFLTKTFENVTMNYYLECFSSTGSVLAQGKLEINVGVFNNSYGINNIVGLGNSAYVLVEHMEKATGKNTLLARQMNSAGKISTTETELSVIPFEKPMNSGFHNAAVSNDNNVLAVVDELPYVKDQSAKIKIALFDKDLKKTSENTLTIPGEDTKNKNITVAVGNDGTVYLIRKGISKIGEIILNVYQYSASSPSAFKEYSLEMTAPLYFFNYTHSVNANNELVVSGTYYERKTVTVGEKMAVGIFYFTNKGQSEKVFKSFPLDQKVENLTARKVIANGSTVFLCAEIYKEERIDPPANGTATSFDYSYNHTHKSEYVIGMDADGNKKFELSMAKDFAARDFNKPYLSGYYICNDKLTVIYNDQARKYTDESGYSSIMPILVQITNDGLMQSPIVFKDKLKIPYNFVLHPSVSVQNATNELTLLLRNNDQSQYMNLKID